MLTRELDDELNHETHNTFSKDLLFPYKFNILDPKLCAFLKKNLFHDLFNELQTDLNNALIDALRDNN